MEEESPKIKAEETTGNAGNTEESISPEQSKKIERQSITLLVILMLVLASFVVAYLLLKPKNYFEYQGMKVFPIRYENSNMIFFSIPLTFSINGQTSEQNVVLRNDPKALENISYDVNQSLFRMAGIGFTMEPTLSSQAVIAAQEIGKLSKSLSLPTFFGITKSFEDKEADVFDCENASAGLRIVRLELGNETKIAQKGYCIVILGENYDSLIKASDRLAFEWLKVLLSRGIEKPESLPEENIANVTLTQNNTANISISNLNQTNLTK